MSAAPQQFRAGDVIANRYLLQAQVGEGGMGAVWRAKHVHLDSDVAIKLMNPVIAQDPEALNRFLREARSAARLSSLHVVKVFDYGVDGTTPFIAMELLNGESLRDRLAREGALAPAQVLRVMSHAGRAVAKAHVEGIIHRDLKPENLFIVREDEELVKVLDFGVAKLRTSSPGLPTSKTRTGALLGTPFYMSPEQAQGNKAVDQRSDIWALGVIAFECLTGKLPFDSDALGALILKICVEPIVVPSAVAAVPPAFDAWFARAAARDPAARFAAVDEMMEALAVALRAEPESAPRTATVLVAPAPGDAPSGRLNSRIDVTASQTVLDGVPRKLSSRRRRWLIAFACALACAPLILFWRGVRERPAAAGSAAPLARARAAAPPSASAEAPSNAPSADEAPPPIPLPPVTPEAAPATQPPAALAPPSPEVSVVPDSPPPSASAAENAPAQREHNAPAAGVAKAKTKGKERGALAPRHAAESSSNSPGRARAKDLFSDPD